MIPKFVNEIEQNKFSAFKAGMISDAKLSEPGNHQGKGPCWGSYFVWNYQYSDLRGKSWLGLQKVIDLETTYINKADEKSNNEIEFEISLRDSDVEFQKLGFVLEVGVMSLTHALSAAGCATISACRAHSGYKSYSKEPQPAMLFYAPISAAKTIYSYVVEMQTAGSDITMNNFSTLNNINTLFNSKVDDDKMIMITTDCITNFLKLAQRMLNDQGSF